MDKKRHNKESEPYQELVLGQGDCGREYSYVGKQVGNDITAGEILPCPKCNTRTLIKDVRKWRLTGAGLICNVCAGVKHGRIVANDNYEVLEVRSGGIVVLPERFRGERCD